MIPSRIIKNIHLGGRAVPIHSLMSKKMPLTSEEKARLAQLESELRKQLEASMALELAKEKQLLILELAKRSESLLANMESELVELIMDVTKRVCQTEVSSTHESTVQWVKEGLHTFSDVRQVIIHLCSQDLENVKKTFGEKLPGVRWVSDETLQNGDVLMESGASLWDGRLSTRLEEVSRLFHRLAKESSDAGKI